MTRQEIRCACLHAAALVFDKVEATDYIDFSESLYDWVTELDKDTVSLVEEQLTTEGEFK